MSLCRDTNHSAVVATPSRPWLIPYEKLLFVEYSINTLLSLTRFLTIIMKVFHCSAYINAWISKDSYMFCRKYIPIHTLLQRRLAKPPLGLGHGWMSNHTPQCDMDVFPYPCAEPNASIAKSRFQQCTLFLLEISSTAPDTFVDYTRTRTTKTLCNLIWYQCNTSQSVAVSRQPGVYIRQCTHQPIPP